MGYLLLNVDGLGPLDGAGMGGTEEPSEEGAGGPDNDVVAENGGG